MSKYDSLLIVTLSCERFALTIASLLLESVAAPTRAGSSLRRKVGEEQSHLPRNVGVVQKLQRACIVRSALLHQAGTPGVEVQLFGETDVIDVSLRHSIGWINEVQFQQVDLDGSHG